MSRNAPSCLIMVGVLIGLVIFIAVLTYIPSVTYLLKPLICSTGELSPRQEWFDSPEYLVCVDTNGDEKDIRQSVAMLVFLFTTIAFAVTLSLARTRYMRLRLAEYQRRMRRGFVLGDDGELIPRDEYDPHLEE